MRSQSVSFNLGTAVRELSVRTAKIAKAVLFPLTFIIQYLRRRSALAELRSLDARTLKDIGLHRGEVWFVADAYARRVPYHRSHTPRSRKRTYHCE